ncbi:hypothetical protein GCM10027589_25500 [Actinocorallia lasiicapitis]
MNPILSVTLAAVLPLSGGGGAKVAFRLADPVISESSGLAASRQHPGIVYTFNDSGGSTQVFALDDQGRTRAVFTIAGAANRDWEAMALGKDSRGRDALFLADIGDNMHGAWPTVKIYRVTEPAEIKSRTLFSTAFTFSYADGARDAETLMIDPRDNRLYVASKLLGNGKVYQAPAKLSTSRTNVLRPVGPAHSFATDGAFAPDGSSFVIRGYFSASLYSAPGQLITTVGLPSQEQGEGITYTPDGRALLISSEGEDRKVWRVPLPEKALPVPKDAAQGGETEKTPGEGTNKGLGLFVLIGVGVAVVAYGRRRK